MASSQAVAVCGLRLIGTTMRAPTRIPRSMMTSTTMMSVLSHP